tara:strand:+ start:123 stop:635 length:513 start_codon:yes stop_codon:yes gene_type:complete
MTENRQEKFNKFRKAKVPDEYDAVIYYIKPGTKVDIYPVEGYDDERKRERGKIEAKEGLGLSAGDRIEVVRGEILLRKKGYSLPMILRKGKEGRLGELIDTRKGPKKPDSIMTKAIQGVADAVRPDGPGYMSRDNAVTGVRGESAVKIRAGDLRALIREAANTESSKDEN